MECCGSSMSAERTAEKRLAKRRLVSMRARISRGARISVKELMRRRSSLGRDRSGMMYVV